MIDLKAVMLCPGKSEINDVPFMSSEENIAGVKGEVKGECKLRKTVHDTHFCRLL